MANDVKDSPLERPQRDFMLGYLKSTLRHAGSIDVDAWNEAVEAATAYHPEMA